MKNKLGKVIYIGKAKNLKKRIYYYFSKKIKDVKTNLLVSQINKIDYIVTKNELEALILESNLIKKEQPKYNINLKDNKSYPFIKITINEKYPRVFKTRFFKQDGGKYFGPYSSAGLVHRNIKLIKSIFPIRSCDFEFPNKRNIDPCLDFFIKKCEGCCINKISLSKYRNYIDQISLFLSGKYSKLTKSLTNKMKNASDNLEFELAGKIKEQIQAIKEINAKQRVYSTKNIDVDVFGSFYKRDVIVLSLLFIREGKFLGKRQFVFYEKEFVGSFNIKILISQVLRRFYLDSDNLIPSEIILSSEPEDKNLLLACLNKLKKKKVRLNVPKIGQKKDWINLACQNAEFTYLNELKITKKELILMDIKNVLKLNKEPRKIEAFDISNTLGHEIVASMVSFYNGYSDKKNYRHFKIKSVLGPNDVASLKEVVSRRYQKLKNENIMMPDLILIDGGKGQVNGVFEILQLLKLNIPLIGLAKKNEEIIFPKIKETLKLEANSYSLRFLQEIRDEAHRFANKFHKKLRSKKMTKSLLEEIPNIGKIRYKTIMNHFKTIDNIKKASINELIQVDKMNKITALAIYNFFH